MRYQEGYRELPAASGAALQAPPHLAAPEYRGQNGGYNPPAQAGQHTQQPEGEGLLGYWRFLWDNKLKILVFGLIGALIGLVASLSQPRMYQAATSLEIQNMNENFLYGRDLDPTAVNSGSDAYMQTQLKILQSDVSLIRRVLDKLKREGKGEVMINSGVVELRNILKLPQKAPTPVSPNQAVAIAKSRLTVRGSSMNRIVDIEYEDPNPRFAADFVDALANEYIDQSVEVRWEAAQRTSEWLSKHLEDSKAKLEAAEQRMQDYAQTNDLLFTSEKDSVAEEKLKQLQAELSRAEADRVAKQSRYESLAVGQQDQAPAILSDTGLRETQAKLTELRRQRAELAATLTPAHPRVKKVEAQIIELQNGMSEERTDFLKRLRNEFQASQQRESLLQKSYNAQVKQVSGESRRAIRYNMLKREVDTARQLYESMVQKVKEAGITSALRSSNIRVINAAEVPERPFKPNTAQNGLMSFCGGLFAGAVLALARRNWRRALQRPGDSTLYLSVPELGVIPSIRLPKNGGFLELGRPRENGTNGTEKALIPFGQAPSARGNGSHKLLPWLRPSEDALAAFQETFRSTLASILYSRPNPPRIVVISSATASEGKSTTVAHMGMVWAEIRQRVLLVDADFFHPSLHEIFELPNDVGLGSILSDAAFSENDPIAKFVRSTSVQGVDVLTSGSRVERDASNLPHSDRMRNLLARLSSAYDVILIDTPPLLVSPIARVLGRLSDGVILVIRAGRTPMRTAVVAKNRLIEDQTPILGTILTDWDPRGTSEYSEKYFRTYYKRAGNAKR